MKTDLQSILESMATIGLVGLVGLATVSAGCESDSDSSTDGGAAGGAGCPAGGAGCPAGGAGCPAGGAGCPAGGAGCPAGGAGCPAGGAGCPAGGAGCPAGGAGCPAGGAGCPAGGAGCPAGGAGCPAGGAAGCPASSSELPAVGDDATVAAWIESGDYLLWQCEDEPHESRSPSPHGPNRICSNEALSSHGDGEYPIGAATVKELYDEVAENVIGYAMLRKMDSGGPESWYLYEATDMAGTIVNGLGSEQAPMQICVGCHSAAGSDAGHSGHDFVYTQVR